MINFFMMLFIILAKLIFKRRKKLGNKIDNGKLMFVYQAFEAFKLWNNIEPIVNDQVLTLLNND